MFKLKEKIILASGSTRRQKMLKESAIDFDTVPSDIEESVLENESPKELVLRLSKAKALAVAYKNPDRWVLGVDTTVTIPIDKKDFLILNKPKNFLECCNMLSKLSGSTHQVIGGISLVNQRLNFCVSKYSVTEVEFMSLDKKVIEAYASTDEPYDKAGGYGIQEKASLFVKKINGSYTNVVGLDFYLLLDMLAQADLIID